MTIGIEMSDRLYGQITDFCVLNGLDMKAYLEEKVERGFSVDRFGDLNEVNGTVEAEDISKKYSVDLKSVFDGIAEARYDKETNIVTFKAKSGEEYKVECFPNTETPKTEEKLAGTTVEEEPKKIKRRQLKSK